MVQMGIVAPNLAALIGDTVGARLISKAGSLTSLAKCPASTIQVLGAEKVQYIYLHILHTNAEGDISRALNRLMLYSYSSYHARLVNPQALFRALKTKGNTPKYGIIYHSTFIGRAAAKNKGRISRVLANKCSIASRIDR